MLGVKTAALPASLRRTNQRTVISLLWRLGCASRADLAKAAGISQPTAGKITAELLELGVLEEAGLSGPIDEGVAGGTPRLGRPGQLLRLDGQRRRFLAIQLGVSETCLSALPVAVKLQDDWKCRVLTQQSPEAWVKEIRKVATLAHGEPLWGVLVSVPGIVDESRGKVLFSPNLHWLEQVDLLKLLAEVWRFPVVLVQEIRALALGHLTAEPGGEDFFLVDFGQGVGGAVVLDGKLYSPPMPLSGELGHTPVPGNKRRCGCGATGCLETLVSRRGLLQSFAATLEDRGARGTPRRSSSTPESAEGAASGSTLPTWEKLVTHVQTHGLEPWLRETLDLTAKVIAGGLNVLGVHRVIVTGSLTELPGFVVEHLSAEIQKGAMWGRFGQVICQSAPRRRAAGLVAVGIDRLVLPINEDSGVAGRQGRESATPLRRS
jgi:predicted NBD/HSP70 family sugar kinase